MLKKSERLPRAALLAACALIAHVIETRLPPPFPALPGVRLGVANIFVLAAFYLPYQTPNNGLLSAIAVMLIKCTLGPLLGGAPVGILFSLTGGALCLPMMLFFKKCKFGKPGVSLAGAVGNQAGQTLLAAGLYRTAGILAMLPSMATLAALCGFLTGLAAETVLKRIPKKFQ